MGLKYYIELIIRKFHHYEKLYYERNIKTGYSAVLNVIVEIAKDDNTISVKDYEEIMFTYNVYLERYMHLVDLYKNKY